MDQNPEKAVVVIGAENCSTEYTQKSIKTKVELIKSKGWEVLFLSTLRVRAQSFDLNDFKVSMNTVATTGKAIEL